MWLTTTVVPGVLEPERLNALSIAGALLVVAGSAVCALSQAGKQETPEQQSSADPLLTEEQSAPVSWVGALLSCERSRTTTLRRGSIARNLGPSGDLRRYVSLRMDTV